MPHANIFSNTNSRLRLFPRPATLQLYVDHQCRCFCQFYKKFNGWIEKNHKHVELGNWTPSEPFGVGVLEKIFSKIAECHSVARLLKLLKIVLKSDARLKHRDWQWLKKQHWFAYNLFLWRIPAIKYPHSQRMAIIQRKHNMCQWAATRSLASTSHACVIPPQPHGLLFEKYCASSLEKNSIILKWLTFDKAKAIKYYV